MECYNSYSYGFGRGLTPLIKKLLIIYGAIYLAELLLVHWVGVNIVEYLVIYPFSSENFHFWQVLTHPFIHSPSDPVSFVIGLLMLYWFGSTLESDLGSSQFLFFFYFCAFGATICGQVLSIIPGFHGTFWGMWPSLTAMFVVFGLLHREATIYLFFMIPVKGIYVAYVTILIVFLTFLAKYTTSLYEIGGILFGYIYYKKPGLFPDQNLLYLKYLQWQYERKKKSRFKVFDGQKGKKNDDGPTFH